MKLLSILTQNSSPSSAANIAWLCIDNFVAPLEYSSGDEPYDGHTPPVFIAKFPSEKGVAEPAD